jgi:parvulin-like peptidyl-prolyl isomerase
MQHHRRNTIATSVVLLGALVVLGGLGGCTKASKDKPAAGSAAGSGSGQAEPATGSGSAGSGAGAMVGSGEGSGSDAVMAAQDIDSKDLLARTEEAKEVFVKHVLLGWKELSAVYQGQMDPRAGKRTNAEAAKLAQEIAAKLKANPDSIDALVKESSEDPGSLAGDPYTVKADSPFVPPFKSLALRLKEKEVGIVRTEFGYHVMVRVPPPAPDPLESVDILKREAGAGPVHVLHVLVGWKDTAASRTGRGDPRALKRSKEEADKLAKQVFDKARGNADMIKLMKEHSEDPGVKENTNSYEIAADTQFVEPFKNLALRLKLNEVGMVKTPFGWHVMKRVAPPPPDPLESADILKREPLGTTAKVKHILLGWTGSNPRDERAKKRDRAALDKLVKATVAKLAKGDKIEPLMAELSEDPGSASNGNSYDVTPDAPFVPPFKALSLRLKPNEVGVVKTDFGIHIIQRVE